MATQVKIFSIAVCPFAQRSRILLRKKGVEFELVEIDITKPRPEWFLKLNPQGKVPVIEHQGRILNESSIINEYLEEVFPTPSFVPADPYEKAIARILVDYGNQTFVPVMYKLLMNQERAQDSALTEAALQSWRWVNDFLERYNPGGLYLSDEAGFSMAEINFAPFFMRYCLNDYYRDFTLPNAPEYGRVRRWRDALLADADVQATGMPDEHFIKFYFDYSLGYGNGGVPAGRERSSFDLTDPVEHRPMPPKSAA